MRSLCQNCFIHEAAQQTPNTNIYYYLVINLIFTTFLSFQGLLLREQPGEIILGLHSMLNSEVPPNWRAVAAEIGVPHHQIQHFSTNIETATKEMLHYWGTSNEATLDRLYKALRKIGRDDACTFLEEKVELESTSVETIV